ncbi:helix-turn-helix domain-containing protein [Oscillibacter valericigenes]|uniref:helix-turn-helix domain-containing protein n=1 Tax=Oscillibacter valericigenes TaxID=351091 RepID=UPI001F42B7FC|nr:helix-turn-helix domain-containing protein [Oscillibacter valericigenes]MCF2663210.1 helix-turn-helix domain-containing protein [Oscillibacter valericigenes]
MIEGYMSIKEAAEIWNVTPRRVQTYCVEGRIEGAAKLGREWAIPASAEKPGDKRIVNGSCRNWRKKKECSLSGNNSESPT